MTARTVSTSSNDENLLVSSKGMGLARTRLQPTKRAPLNSFVNRSTEPTTGIGPNKISKNTSVFVKPLIRDVRVFAKPVVTVRVAKTTSASVASVLIKDSAIKAKDVDVIDLVEESPIPMDISKVDALADAFANSQLLDVEDTDADDGDNPQLASAYVNEIYAYMRQLEITYSVCPNYLEGKVITGRMRGILVDWLCQVVRRFELLPETFYLTVNILDRYMQKRTVTKDKLQLVGVTALFIAAKYEEIYAPSIDDLSMITDRAYAPAEIRRMEVIMLKRLDFGFGCPLPLHFLRRISKVGRVDVTVHTLAKYVSELAAIEYDLVHYKPSHIAAASLYLSLTLLARSATWSDTLVHYSKYTDRDVKPLACKLAAMIIKAEKSKLQAVFNKYKSGQLLSISTIEELRGDKIKALAALASC